MLMLSERSPVEKTAYFMTPHLENSYLQKKLTKLIYEC